MAEIKLKIASVVIGSGEGGGSGVAPYYADLPDKPSINGETLSGDMTAAQLGLQPTLESGTNIKTINNQSIVGSGNITIEGGGTDDYSELSNQPQINSITLSGNKSASDLGLATAAQGDLANTAYQKPQTGIPSTDLASGVQTSLDKADTALQPLQSGQYTENNFASFDSNGRLQDSGFSDGTFIKGVQQNGDDLPKDEYGMVNVTVQDGEDGLSAFEIAQQQGYTGTVDQWLASLKANIGAFKFINPTDTTAEAALTTIGSTYASAIGGVSPSQSTLSIILLMNDSNNTKTMMIATQEAATAGTYEFVYAGDLQSAMSSNVLTEDDIDNSFAGGSDKVAGAEEAKTLNKNLFNNLFTIQGYIYKSNGNFKENESYYCTDFLELDKPTVIRFKGYSSSLIAAIAFYDENKTYIGSTITSTGYKDYTVSSEDMQSLETLNAKTIKYARFTTDTNKGYIYEGLTVVPLFMDMKNKVNSTDFASEIKKLNGNIFTEKGFYIDRVNKEVKTSTDDYVVSKIMPLDRSNDLVFKGYNSGSLIAGIMFLDEDFIPIYCTPSSLSSTFTLTAQQIDEYEQDNTINPNSKKFSYYIACTRTNDIQNSYCYNCSISSLSLFSNKLKELVDSLVATGNESAKNRGEISDTTISFSNLLAGFYTLYATSGNVFSDLPQREKANTTGARRWELCVFKVNYGVIYILKRVQNIGSSSNIMNWYPNFYIGFQYANFMNSIEWQTIKTDLSVLNHGKTITMTGDSIMAKLLSTTGPAIQYLESLTNFTIIDTAIGGTSIAYRNNADADAYNPKSLVARSISGNADYIDVSNTTKLIIWMGVNDRSANIPLGNDDSVDNGTVMGAMRNAVTNFLTTNPHLSICFVTPNANPNLSPNSLGLTLEDYANRIKSACEILNVECFDMFHESCINDTNKTQAFSDGLHPTSEWLEDVALDKFKRIM